MRERFAKSYETHGYIRALNSALENDLIRILKKYGITFPSFRTLWILYFDTEMTMSDLTYIAQTNISNAFRQLTKLNEDGLVQIESGKDSRTKILSITESGRKIIQEFIDEHVKSSDLQIVSILEKIPEEDLAKFIEVASFLSTELIGETYTQWIKKSKNMLLD